MSPISANVRAVLGATFWTGSCCEYLQAYRSTAASSVYLSAIQDAILAVARLPSFATQQGCRVARQLTRSLFLLLFFFLARGFPTDRTDQKNEKKKAIAP